MTVLHKGSVLSAAFRGAEGELECPAGGGGSFCFGGDECPYVTRNCTDDVKRVRG